MYFALFYIFFFALDILIATRFETLGMIPMNFLVSGVSLFMIIFMRMNKSAVKRAMEEDPPFYLLYTFIIATFLINFYHGAFRFFVLTYIMPPMTEFLYVLDHYIDIAMILLSLTLFISVLTHCDLSAAVCRWSLQIAVTAFFKYSLWWFSWVRYGSPGHHLLMRYGGVMDLAIIFGWLMVVSTTLKKEHDIHADTTGHFAVH